MKINAGKKYEGASSNRLEDGDYELQIIDVQTTKGRVNMTLATSKNQKVYKTFFLLERDGKTPNEKGLAELADYITTAMQIEDEEVEVTVEKVLGYYLLCYVKNGSYTKEDGTVKKVYNVYSPRRCNGFSDGTDSFIEGDESDEEEFDEEVTEEVTSEETSEELPFDDSNGDVFAKYGIQ